MILSATGASNQLGIANESQRSFWQRLVDPAQGINHPAERKKAQLLSSLLLVLAMNNINQSTVQNLASTRETEKAARNLTALARGLAESVEQYRL